MFSNCFRYLPELKPEDKLRNLAKDGRDNLKDKYQVDYQCQHTNFENTFSNSHLLNY